MNTGITNINGMITSEADIEAEKRYRIEERLGIMCGAGVPTDEQLAIAIEEAEQWEATFRLSLL